MTFQGAIVKEQGVTFGIVITKEHVLNNQLEANRMINDFQLVMGVNPVVLMVQDIHGVPRYYGRDDIVRFLASIDFRRIPWKQYSIG